MKDKKQKEDISWEKNIYHDPLVGTKINDQEKYSKKFFRIKRKYLDEFWKLSNSEILLLINIWIYNKEKKQKQLTNKELTTIQGYKFYSSCPSRIIKKLNKIGIVKVKDDFGLKKYNYDWGKKENNFCSVPITNIVNYVHIFGRKKIKIYIYMLYKFYNVKNLNTGNFGVRKLPIPSKEIQKKLGYSSHSIIGKAVSDYDKLGLIKRIVRGGKPNLYYLPFVINQQGIWNTRTKKELKKRVKKKTNNKKNKDKSKETKKIHKNHNEKLWVNSQGIKNTHSFWKKQYGNNIEKMKEQNLLRRVKESEKM